jgi:hypothetical protein
MVPMGTAFAEDIEIKRNAATEMVLISSSFSYCKNFSISVLVICSKSVSNYIFGFLGKTRSLIRFF